MPRWALKAGFRRLNSPIAALNVERPAEDDRQVRALSRPEHGRLKRNYPR